MRFLIPFFLGATLLAGCGGSGGRDDTVTSSSGARPVEVSNPRFSDKKPHPYSGRSPASYSVHGIDVARYQGPIDWRTARNAGVSFAFIKSTEGVEELDPMFHEHWRGAKAAGVPHAAYHFYYFCASAVDQARWFIANVPREPGGLPHVLDLEWNHRSPTCQKRPDGATVRAEASRFLAILERHYGQRPIIYTSLDFDEDTDITRLSGTQFWLRSVAGHPSEKWPGKRWSFWQYTGTGHVPGVSGSVDINVFAGSESAWKGYGR